MRSTRARPCKRVKALACDVRDGCLELLASGISMGRALRERQSHYALYHTNQTPPSQSDGDECNDVSYSEVLLLHSPFHWYSIDALVADSELRQGIVPLTYKVSPFEVQFIVRTIDGAPTTDGKDSMIRTISHGVPY